MYHQAYHRIYGDDVDSNPVWYISSERACDDLAIGGTLNIQFVVRLKICYHPLLIHADKIPNNMNTWIDKLETLSLCVVQFRSHCHSGNTLWVLTIIVQLNQYRHQNHSDWHSLVPAQFLLLAWCTKYTQYLCILQPDPSLNIIKIQLSSMLWKKTIHMNIEH